MPSFSSVFPASERVVFSRNPITSVQAEIRYDIHFGIKGQSPTSFRAALQAHFPQYVEEAYSIQLPSPDGTSYSEELRPLHRFSSQDGRTSIRLGELSLSVQSRDYVSWEQFRGIWNLALETFSNSYELPSVKSVALRYVDTFSRATFGLKEKLWNELFKPELLGMMGGSSSESVQSLVCQTILRLNEHEHIATIKTGILSGPNDEQLLQLDAEFACPARKEFAEILSISDDLKRHAGRFFRWAITDELRGAMDPSPIPDFRPE